MLWLRSKIVLTGLALVAALVIIFLLFGKTNVAAEDYANLMGQVSSAEFSSRKSAFLVQYEAQQHKVVEEAEEVVKNYTSGVNPWKKSTVDTYVKKRGIEYKWSEKQVGNANIVYNVLMDEANRNAIIAKVKGTSVLSKDDYLNYKIFICAVIGNICGEGTAGMLEGYTDTYWHGYVSKWKADTGKSLTSKQQAEVMSVYNTVSAWAKKSSGETRYIDTPSEVDTMLQLGSFNGIGVGMVQWSNGRRVELLQLYKNYITKNKSSKLTNDELMTLDTQQIVNDFLGNYSTALVQYCKYLKEFPNTSTEDRLRIATGAVYAKYEVPSNSFCCFKCGQRCYTANSNGSVSTKKCECSTAQPNVIREGGTKVLYKINENHKRMWYARTAFDTMFK